MRFAWFALCLLTTLPSWAQHEKPKFQGQEAQQDSFRREVVIVYRGTKPYHQIYSMALEIESRKGSLRVVPRPEPVIPRGSLLERPLTDVPLRETVHLMQQLEKFKYIASYRSAFERNHKLLIFPLQLSIRGLDGEVLDQKQTEVTVQLSGDDGIFRVRSALGFDSRRDKIREYDVGPLKREDGYRQFLEQFYAGFSNVKFKIPERKRFVVELYGKWPRVYGCRSADPESCIGALAQYARKWFPHIFETQSFYPNQLGASYYERSDSGWVSHHAAQLKQLDRALQLKQEARKVGGQKESLRLWRDYFQLVPSDQQAARRLVELSLLQEDSTRAVQLIHAYQPYFVAFGAPLRIDVEPFRDDDAFVRIIHPAQDDTVAGAVTTEVIVKDNHQSLSRIGFSLDGQELGFLDQPPLHFELDSVPTGRHRLKALAAFADGSVQWDEIEFDSIEVNESAATRLAELLVMGSERPLDREGFELSQADLTLPIESSQHLREPIEIAILVDSSASMAGWHLHYAQYAIDRFLGALSAGDAAAVYAFEHRVLKLKSIHDDPESFRPILFTMIPQNKTALYDAILTARTNLLDRKSTSRLRVLVVLADGDENISQSTAVQVNRLMGQSPILVYAIMLSSNTGFLKQLAESSGGFARRIGQIKKLDQIFGQILTELRNAHYLSYYTSKPPDQDVLLEHEEAGKLRWLSLNRGESVNPLD